MKEMNVNPGDPLPQTDAPSASGSPACCSPGKKSSRCRCLVRILFIISAVWLVVFFLSSLRLIPDPVCTLFPGQCPPHISNPPEGYFSGADVSKQDLDKAMEAVRRKMETLVGETHQRIGAKIAYLMDEVGHLKEKRALTQNDDPQEPPISPSVLADITDMKEKIAGMQRKISDIEQKIVALPRETEKVPDGMKAGAPLPEHFMILTYAIFELQRLALEGKPFTPALEIVSSLGSSYNPQVLKLIPHAAKGIPTRVELEVMFGRIAFPLLKAAEQGEHEKQNSTLPLHMRVFSFLKDAVSKFIQIRPIGHGHQPSLAAQIAEVEILLQQNDLRKALSFVEKLEGKAEKVTEEWRTAAQARLDLETLLDDMRRDIIAPLALTGKENHQ